MIKYIFLIFMYYSCISDIIYTEVISGVYRQTNNERIVINYDYERNRIP